MRIPVIIDTDPGVDDILAILLALASPELEILAFVVTFGNTDVDSSRSNIFKLYQELSRHFEAFPEDRVRFPNFEASPKPFIVRGAERPLEGDSHSATYFHGRDGLGNLTARHPELNVPTCEYSDRLPHPQLTITDQSAASLVLDLIKLRALNSVTYICLGPLTSLAQILRADDGTFRNGIGHVVCMGGALDVPGNTSPVAEFNFFADPYAVKQLLQSSPSTPSLSLPLDRFILLPLDVTTPHQLKFTDYQARVDPKFHSTTLPSRAVDKSPLKHFTSSFLENTREIMLKFGNDALELHDIVAVWCAIENSPSNEKGLRLREGWQAVKRQFKIERTGELTRGMLVVDRRGDNAPGANRAELQAQIDASHHGHLESTAVPAMTAADLDIRDEMASNEVWCIRKTPGSETLVKVLLSRVWGVKI